MASSTAALAGAGIGSVAQNIQQPNQTQMQSQVMADISDPNNLSAMGMGANNIVQNNNTIPTEGMAQDLLGQPPMVNSAVGNITPPITTGSFTPQTQQVAQGIYGNENARQASVTKKPLINIL